MAQTERDFERTAATGIFPCNRIVRMLREEVEPGDFYRLAGEEDRRRLSDGIDAISISRSGSHFVR
jgi:hypothetical protein